jgi:hypothetical protein
MGMTRGEQLMKESKPSDEAMQLTGAALRKICDGLSIRDLEA